MKSKKEIESKIRSYCDLSYLTYDGNQREIAVLRWVLSSDEGES